MLPVILICSFTCLLMIAGVLFFPKLKIGKLSVSSYWVVTLLGACVLLLSGQCDASAVFHALTADTAVNPLKILVLFLSMTVLSVFLDELGFFRYLADAALKLAHRGQKRLFLLLYLTVSVLTVFTSNDIIILSFTPFICYFAKNAGISPTPYLAAEFVAANTWSMALIIGNPTNIYLATAYDIDFVEYLRYSALPTLFAGTVAFLALFLLFRKKLSEPIKGEPAEERIGDRLLLAVGLFHLGVCTVLLAIGSYIGLEMWLVALCCVISLFLVTGVIAAVRRKKPKELFDCVKRTPYALVPFVLSMFVMIVALSSAGVTDAIGKFLGEEFVLWKYGAASFLASNLINNIPMSVLFSSILQGLKGTAALEALFATVIGSNIGAFFTPIGALAGLMWSDILHKHGVKFGYLDFLKLGAAVALPTLCAALGGLAIVV